MANIHVAPVGVAHYTRRFHARHEIVPAGLTASAGWEMAENRPAPVGRISVTIQAPPGLPEERLGALLAVAAHCTVHNSLARPPQSIDLGVGAVA